jgi:predicted ArsR family transcriptional regulator
MAKTNNKRAVCEALLRQPEWTYRTDSYIASTVGCSHNTVRSTREALEARGEIPHAEILLGRDNKEYPRYRRGSENRFDINDRIARAQARLNRHQAELDALKREAAEVEHLVPQELRPQ